jgi:hypothetical protein
MFFLVQKKSDGSIERAAQKPPHAYSWNCTCDLPHRHYDCGAYQTHRCVQPPAETVQRIWIRWFKNPVSHLACVHCVCDGKLHGRHIDVNCAGPAVDNTGSVDVRDVRAFGRTYTRCGGDFARTSRTHSLRHPGIIRAEQPAYAIGPDGVAHS